jgi:hypothetical protein
MRMCLQHSLRFNGGSRQPAAHSRQGITSPAGRPAKYEPNCSGGHGSHLRCNAALLQRAASSQRARPCCNARSCCNLHSPVATRGPGATRAALLQHARPCCNTLGPVATRSALLQHARPCCNTLGPVATRSALLQHARPCCNTLGPVAIHTALLQPARPCSGPVVRRVCASVRADGLAATRGSRQRNAVHGQGAGASHLKPGAKFMQSLDGWQPPLADSWHSSTSCATGHVVVVQRCNAASRVAAQDAISQLVATLRPKQSNSFSARLTSS